jgi:hypothetical protein
MPEPMSASVVVSFLANVGKLATFQSFKKQLFQQNEYAAAQLQSVFAELALVVCCCS